MSKFITIIGGMGPQASHRLHGLMLKKSEQFHDGKVENLPGIVHLSLQIPDFVSDQTKEKFAVNEINRAINSVALKSAMTCIACNTAHKLLPELDTDSTFVSMIESVVDAITESNTKSVGIIASSNTVDTKLYEAPLLRRNIKVINLDNSDLHRVDSLIRDVLLGESNSDTRNELNRIAKKLENKGASSILLGCTELPLIGIDTKLKVFDSLNELSNSLVNRFYLL